VLKPGGRCLVTFFIVDDTARGLIGAGVTPPARRFLHRYGDTWVVDTARPEAALAYEESILRELYRDAALTIRDPVLFGSWSGRQHPMTPHSQDIVVATRLPAGAATADG
jgi:hypothetical protein